MPTIGQFQFKEIFT